jgi:hypothetical protein
MTLVRARYALAEVVCTACEGRYFNERFFALNARACYCTQVGLRECTVAARHGVHGVAVVRWRSLLLSVTLVALQVPPGTAGTDSNAWQPQVVHLAVSPRDLQAGRLESIVMSLPYATHVLDMYSMQRFDKRLTMTCAPRRIGMQESNESGMCHTAC